MLEAAAAGAARRDPTARWIAIGIAATAVGDLFVAAGILAAVPYRPAVVFVDFFMLWSSARYVLEQGLAGLWGAPLEAFQSALLGAPHGWHPFPYPPPFLLFVLPLGLLGYFGAYYAFMGTTAAAYVVAAAGRRPGPATALALLTAPAALVNALYGHNGFLTASLLAGGMRLLRTRPALAGALLGLLVYKPQLAIVVPVALVAAGAWRALVAAACAAAAFVLVSLLAFGISPWLDWLEFLPGFSAGVLANGGLFFWKMASLAPALLRLGLPFGAAMAAQSALALAALALVFLVFRRAGRTREAAALLLVAPFLVTPYAYAYDVPSTAIAVAWLAAEGLRSGTAPAERLVLALAWFVPLAAIFPLPPSLGPVAPLAMIALAGVAAARALAVPRVEAPRGGAPPLSRP